MKKLMLAVFSFIVFGSVSYAQTTEKISSSPTGSALIADFGRPAQNSLIGISPSGRYVAFASNALNAVTPNLTRSDYRLYLRDRTRQETRLICEIASPLSGAFPVLCSNFSSDERFLALMSSQRLVAQDTNSFDDVYRYDIETRQFQLGSVNNQGIVGDAESGVPILSANGRFVLFRSTATNLVADYRPFARLYVHDFQTGETTLENLDSHGNLLQAPAGHGISEDGNLIFFSHYRNPPDRPTDASIRNRSTGVTRPVSVNSQGELANNEGAFGCTMSRDGRYAVFQSWATNLVPNIPDFLSSSLYLHDTQTGQTNCLNVDPDGNPVLGAFGHGSFIGSIDGTNRFVSFTSSAASLVANDTNGHADVFVRDLRSQKTIRVSLAVDGAQVSGESRSGVTHDTGNPQFGGATFSISDGGRYVLFSSTATNLPGAIGTPNVYLRDRGEHFACPVDWNHDGGVTIDDLLLYLEAFQQGRADVDEDGGTTIEDLLEFLMQFERGNCI